MTYGFIGTGNMGGALARALVKTVSPTDIFLNNRTMARAEALAAELGAHCADAETIASSCGCIFLGVKPHLLPGVLAQLRPTLTAREDKPLLVSMAAGVTIAAIEKAVPGSRGADHAQHRLRGGCGVDAVRRKQRRDAAAA